MKVILVVLLLAVVAYANIAKYVCFLIILPLESCILLHFAFPYIHTRIPITKDARSPSQMTRTAANRARMFGKWKDKGKIYLY
jgi:hypothetical protein